jgi:tryptophan synthase beta chain
MKATRTPTAWQPRFGAFGEFGGRYVSELLWPALAELSDAVDSIVADAAFRAELDDGLRTWAGRPTPLTHAPRLSQECALELWLKREDLLHGGAHKTNNALGQVLLARRLGKRRLIAETGAGQHGVATAMAAARAGLPLTVYMGARDCARQQVNVERMRLLGAEVVAVGEGSATLKDAINEALRDWATNLATTHYVLGSVCGPDPFPKLVREFQAVIGREARAQFAAAAGGRPDAVVACVGGGSNAIGLFSGFLDDERVARIGVEAGGRDGGGAAKCARGRAGVLHGARTLVLQDDDGQIEPSASIAAGLDYPAIGPEHAALQAAGRAQYVAVNDDGALAAFAATARLEGIVPALESAHALAFVLRAVRRGELPRGARVVVNVSGRGDKDLAMWMKVGPARTKDDLPVNGGFRR